MLSKANRVINTIKELSIDMMHESKITYADTLLRSTDLLYSLFAKIMIINPKDPTWINRDRLILSTNHNSAMLYSTLHLAGYDISIEDLKKYCKDGSKTPENLDPRITPGVDAPDGTPGEGIAMAVGMAIAEKYLANLLNQKKEIISYNTYVMCSVDDITSGIAQEALSLAGELKLNNLFLIFEYNKNEFIKKNKFLEEDIDKRLKSYGFNVYSTSNTHRQLSAIINRHQESKFPTAVIVNNVLGLRLVYESVSKLKGEPLTEKDYKNLKKNFNSCPNPFETKQEEKECLPSLIEKRCFEEYNLWKKDYEEFKETASDELKQIIDSLENGKLVVNFDSEKFKVKETYNEDLLKSNLDIMKIINKKNPLFMGGSPDVSINKSDMSKGYYFCDNGTDSNTIEFGNRLTSLGAILNGMALCGLKVFGNMPLIYSDVTKSALKLSAISKLPVTYIYNHDTPFSTSYASIYQPNDQIGMLRNMIDVNVFRPADISELFGIWEYILKHNDKPNALILGSKEVMKQEGTNCKYVSFGAYILKKEQKHLDAIIISTGNEVPLALEVAKELESDYDIRVVSMPSMNLFLEQDKKYQNLLFPKDIPTFVIEASKDANWFRFAINEEHIFGINKYGKCCNEEELRNYYELNKKDIIKKIKKLL